MMATPVSGDGELVTRALGGESAAFGELYNRYFPSVYDFLFRTLRDSEDAADAAQETFLRAMRSLASLPKPAAFKSWLFSIAYGRAMDRLARGKRLFSLPPGADAESDSLFQQVDSERLAEPEQAPEMQETARLVWEAATVLDRRAYAVLDLHVRQGLTSAEMAEVLGVGKGNAFTMLNRLMRSVEEVFGAYLLMRRGVESCQALGRIVGRFAIPPLTQDMCRAVERHVENCAVCQQTRRSLLAPLAVFGAFAAAPAPTGLMERIWKNLETQWTRPGRRAVKKARLGKGLWMLARKSETAERGSGQTIGGRDLFLVLCAVLVLAALPVIAVFSLSVSGSSSPSVSPTSEAATKRPPTATRTVGPTPTVTLTRMPTSSPTEGPLTITPVGPATQHPRLLPTTPPTRKPAPSSPATSPAPQPTGPTTKPPPTPRPTKTPWATPPPLF
ncbi:MAG: sigma-70 family RNA polymerase sigma factor [Dehalococcoidia bacterium]|jgi:RNA polymerase sigma factor (sigma-70 family)